MRFQTRFIQVHLRQLLFWRRNLFQINEYFNGPKIDISPKSGQPVELTDDASYRVGYDFFIFELRRHSGETVAMQYAFAVHFLRWIVIPAVIGLSVALAYAVNGIDDRTYSRTIAAYGLLVPSIWIPIYIRMWQRKCAELSVIWNTSTTNERAYLNKEYSGATSKLTSDLIENGEDDTNGKYRVFPFYVVFFISQLIVMMVGTSVFISCHVYLNSYEACNTTTSYVCLSSATRWVLSIIISVSMGALMSFFQVKAKSIASWFAKMENHRLEFRLSESLIEKTFWMQWTSLYPWFMSVSFAFVAFGEDLHAFLEANASSLLVFKFDRRAFDLNSTLVVPIYAYLGINFVILTMLPSVHLLRKHRRIVEKSKEPIELQVIDQNQRLKAHSFSAQLRFNLDMPVGIHCPDIQQSFRDLVESMNLTQRASYKDYDDIVVYLGIIASFSVVSPIISVIACVHALCELHCDVLKMAFVYQRSQPRRARNAGSWEKYLLVAMVLGGIISVGMVCFSTGHLEAFVQGCERSANYGPNHDCVSISYRIMVALLLEHLVLILQALTMSLISREPKWIAWRSFDTQRRRYQFMKNYKKTEGHYVETRK
uniref:Anoctamin transmembrane domain-containing protein n=1 Tax=Spongospora subterranea TaxID=70186 RepID=A0A0H5RD61_9EUKA|eukprot:CRZ11923.1 hypothetical protein [Spongospora subterranea]